MSKNSTTKTKSEPWSAAKPYLTGALGEAQNLFDQGGFAADPYQGPRVAPQSAATTGAQEGILTRAANGVPGIDAAKNWLTGMMDGSNIYNNMQGVRDSILGSAIPAAGAMFSGSGMLNSSTAMDGVGRAATEALAPFEYGAYENAQNRGMTAAGMMPQMEAASYLPYEMQGNVGAAQDAYAKANIDAEMAKYYETQGQDAANFSPYLNAIMGLGGMGGTGSSTAPNPGMGVGPAITGGLGMYGGLLKAGAGAGMATGGGILAALAGLSDRRAKENIVRIGQTDKGNTLYRFNYIGIPGLHIGVMADEVPHAIAGTIDGYSIVDYAQV